MTEHDERLLTGIRRPVVILPGCGPDGEGGVADAVAPRGGIALGQILVGASAQPQTQQEDRTCA